MKLSSLIVLFAASGDAKPSPEARATMKAKKNSQDLAWELLFNSGTSEENKVISPVCITGAMYMLAAGAKGQTQQEIFDILTKTLGQGPEETFQKYNDLRNFHSDSGNAHTLNIANGVFANEGMIEEGYTTLLTDTYQLTDSESIQTVDFENDNEGATEQINQWIYRNTNGMIDPMYEEALDPDMAILLSSSLYFKGSWESKFKTDFETDYKPCWSVLGDTTTCMEDVKFMQHNGQYRTLVQSFRGFTAEIVEVPMKQSNFEFKGHKYENQMVFQIWYPNDDIRNPEMDKKMQDLIRAKYHKIRTNENYANGPQSVKLTMPKFEIDFDQDVKKLMGELGIETVFSKQKDLSPMVGDNNNDVDISKINHKVKFELDEEGVEGAAAANVEISFRNLVSPKPIVIARPFYFTVSAVCRNKTRQQGCPYGNIPIFIGKVTDPTNSAI
jgi:serpin B